jgi:hypothetical protein
MGLMGAEEYRRNARRCLELAREMVHSTHRAKMIDLAASWTRLAEEAEKNREADPTNKLPLPTIDPAKRVAQQQQQVPPKEEGGKE